MSADFGDRYKHFYQRLKRYSDYNTYNPHWSFSEIGEHDIADVIKKAVIYLNCLKFQANSRIKLIKRVDNEWLYGVLRSGAEGLFPSNYVEIKVPLANDRAPPPARLGLATALYDFEPVQPGDLRFLSGDTISVIHKLSDEWYFGECNGAKGQFPVNYVQMV